MQISKTVILTVASVAMVSISLAVVVFVIILLRNKKINSEDFSGYAIQPEDLMKSATADLYAIDNTTTEEDTVANLKYLIMEVLEPLFNYQYFTINSGYRTPELNKLVGSKTNSSQHTKGEAADITSGSKEANKRLFDYVKANLPYDQLINESNYSWIHISLKRTGYNRKQTLTL